MDQVSLDGSSGKHAKSPVVRGARACTICRAAKMKCVGAEDGEQPCQRCRRANTECVFEKHRRGRKPGSKLSEASKMLRRLEKGLNNAKLKSQAVESALSPGDDPRLGGVSDAQIRLAQLSQSDFRSDPTARRSFLAQRDPAFQSQISGSSSMDEEEDIDGEPHEDGMYPAKLIKKERQRNSFFGTVLGPSGTSKSPEEHVHTSVTPTSADRNFTSKIPPSFFPAPTPLEDPVQMGLMDEKTAENIMDMVLIRLNPFINLFDPELHSCAYFRKKCPFLFTILLMAGSKFFNAPLYPKCRELADQHAIKAFAEQKKSVEVVQAFMCLTYWKEPDDTRVWTYIGYACRLAVELNLNRYVPRPPETETELQRLERRNRERTYLVGFVHDRSLSMQTGRLWMLPEDDLVECYNWHEHVPPGIPIRPEDVIVSALVSLRLIATETTKVLDSRKGSLNGQLDNYDFLLNASNSKLSQWSNHWSMEMKRANGQPFHHSFLEFFMLYVGLFLNSFGIHHYMCNSQGGCPPSLEALLVCYKNAFRCLEIIVKEIAPVQMLQYSQDSITVMTAYCSLMLLRLMRKSTLKTDAVTRASVFDLILKTADAYKEAGLMMPSSSSSTAHSRFLRRLVEREKLKSQQMGRERMENIDPTLQATVQYAHYSPTMHNTSQIRTPSDTIASEGSRSATHFSEYGPPQQLISQPNGTDANIVTTAEEVYPQDQYANPTNADHVYYANMCRELGVTQGVDLIQGNVVFYPRMPDAHAFAMMGQ